MLFIARDRKHHLSSVGSEVDDKEGKVDKTSTEITIVPKSKKGVDSDSDDDAFDDRPA